MRMSNQSNCTSVVMSIYIQLRLCQPNVCMPELNTCTTAIGRQRAHATIPLINAAGGNKMTVSPLAGRKVQSQDRADITVLVADYYALQPDTSQPGQLVSFGTSGHRG